MFRHYTLGRVMPKHEFNGMIMKGMAGLAELHMLGYGNPSVKIAVLDGPVDLQHACFQTDQGKLIPWNNNQVKPSASAGLALMHGTAVCSLIFGKPGSAVQGIAPGCSGIIIPIYAEDEYGNFSAASQARLAKSIKIALSEGAHIINISGGQFSKYGDPEFLLKQAIEDCYKAGVLIVAAAGNEGCNCLHVPASDRQVLAVGSMDESGLPTPETNFGNHYLVNGIIAPGKNLTAALAGGETFQTNGATSYATPVVSGIVGLLMSLQIKYGLKPDAFSIKTILESTAIPCPENGTVDCKRFLRGKLNLPAAIAAIKNSPGISDSGIEFHNGENIFSVPHNKKISLSEPALPNSAEVMMSHIPTEQLAKSCQPITPIVQSTVETLQSIENPEMILTDNAVEPADTILTDISSFTLSRDGPVIISSRKKNGSPELYKSNPIIKNLNLKKMENNTKTQNVELSGTIESSNFSQIQMPSAEIKPSDCGCGCGGKKESDQGENDHANDNAGENGNGNGNGSTTGAPEIVYALGTLGYDFGSEAHQDSFVQSMGGGNPNDPAAILKYLKSNPWAAEELTWTLNIDATPIYALHPAGSYSLSGYERIRQYYEQQQNGNIQRISVPGVSQGSTILLNGHTVDNLIPNLRGMYSWTTEALTATATGAKGSAKALAEHVSNFLNRIYYQMRNLGVTPQERSLNYAATNAYQVSAVFASALKENLELNDISSEKSPICRPGSDCYDVTLSFFNPKERLTVARKEFRFTIDVSDVVPVTVGEIRSWSVY